MNKNSKYKIVKEKKCEGKTTRNYIKKLYLVVICLLSPIMGSLILI